MRNMDLTKIFAKLQIPETESQNVFNAKSIDQYKFAKIAINNVGHPIILIHSDKSGGEPLPKN